MLDVNTNQQRNNQCLDCYQMASSLIVLEPVAMIEVVKYHENDNQEIIKKNVNGSTSHVLGRRNFETMSLDVMDPHYQEEEEHDGGNGNGSGSGSDGGPEKRKAYLHSVLAAYQDQLLERADHFLGYPCYVDKDRSELTHQLQSFPINNVGDPFTPSTYAIHSRWFEIAVLDWFARLWGIEKNKYWGYVTNGSTEGNCHGILIGREMFPDGILYASRESHYSVTKAAFMYRMELVTVDSLITGELDCADFKTMLLLNKSKPAIILVNIGTTIKGAVDDLDEVIRTLEEAGFTQDRFYIHCDGALSGFMLPFLKNAPKLTFKKPIGSISVSGHKFMGCPTPCGIQITRMEHINTLSRKIEYIATLDATITGSRSGHTPIFLWCILNQQGYKGFEKRVQKCIVNARYLKDRLQEEGISVLLNEFSNTVVFERPKDDEFVRHWQLACQDSIAHIVIMPSINTELIQQRSFWYKDQDKVDGPPCVAQVIGNENCACFMHKYSSTRGRSIAGNGYIPQN